MKKSKKAGTISVIVPVYNVEEYLPRCIESICGQTYRDLEIILVDDGSADGSSEICQKYAERDSRIRYIRTKNRGVSAARNKGLELAAGQWIGFVDADDYVDSRFYEKLIEEAEQSDKKIICCGVIAQDPDGNLVERMKGRKFPARIQDLDREEALLRFLNPDTRILYWATWDKLFSADLLKDVFFEKGRGGAEDFDFSLRCILRSDGVRYVPDELYHYLVRPGSLVKRSGFSKSSFDRMFFADRAAGLISEAGIGGEVLRCAKINIELSGAKILHDCYKEGADPKQFEPDLNVCRKAVGKSGHEVLRASLVRGKRICWSAVTLKSKVLCMVAEHCEKLLRFV